MFTFLVETQHSIRSFYADKKTMIELITQYMAQTNNTVVVWWVEDEEWQHGIIDPTTV